jgi:uncharacterized damage-inducible protein DinB
MRLLNSLLILLACGGLTNICAATAGRMSIAEIQEHTLSDVEHEIVPLAEAMPADKYDFAPTQGAFDGVRTFGKQMSHVAAVLNEFAAGLLGEKGFDAGENENGPASLSGKDAIVAYLKSSFEHAHKALKTLNEQNFTDPGEFKMTKGQMAELMAWHTFDHYGQAVVYARMNGIVPPASRH